MMGLWDVEATGAPSEGLAVQDMGPSQIGNSVALQRGFPMSQRESVQDDDVSLARENADVSLERENADASIDRGAVSGASRAVETSSLTPTADEHVETSSVTPAADEHVQQGNIQSDHVALIQDSTEKSCLHCLC